MDVAISKDTTTVTKTREIMELPMEVRIHILRQIILRNNAEECKLIEESRQCRDELLKLGVEAFPPFPKDIKAEMENKGVK